MMSPDANIDMVVDQAKTAQQQIRNDAVLKYKQRTGAAFESQKVLDMQPIAKTLAEEIEKYSFKGEILDADVARVAQSLANDLDAWLKRNPNEYHTVEGLDAFKRQIGLKLDGLNKADTSTKQARGITSAFYNSIKNQIVKEAPIYAEAMKGYEDLTTQMMELDRVLGLKATGGQVNVDRAIRALTSSLRNNVNTAFGKRLTLAQTLAKTPGGKNLLTNLAGIELSGVLPRGLSRASTPVAAAGTALAVAGGKLTPAVLPLIAAGSPKIGGRVAQAVGQLQRPFSYETGLRSIPRRATSAPTRLTAYQLGRMQRELEEKGLMAPRSGGVTAINQNTSMRPFTVR